MNAPEVMQSVCLLVLALWHERLSRRQKRLRAAGEQLRGIVIEHLEGHDEETEKVAKVIETVKDKLEKILEATSGK